MSARGGVWTHVRTLPLSHMVSVWCSIWLLDTTLDGYPLLYPSHRDPTGLASINNLYNPPQVILRNPGSLLGLGFFCHCCWLIMQSVSVVDFHYYLFSTNREQVLLCTKFWTIQRISTKNKFVLSPICHLATTLYFSVYCSMSSINDTSSIIAVHLKTVEMWTGCWHQESWTESSWKTLFLLVEKGFMSRSATSGAWNGSHSAYQCPWTLTS